MLVNKKNIRLTVSSIFSMLAFTILSGLCIQGSARAEEQNIALSNGTTAVLIKVSLTAFTESDDLMLLLIYETDSPLLQEDHSKEMEDALKAETDIICQRHFAPVMDQLKKSLPVQTNLIGIQLSRVVGKLGTFKARKNWTTLYNYSPDGYCGERMSEG